MERETNKKRIKYGIITLAVLIILTYSGFQAQKIWQGPQIILTSPVNGATVNQSLIDIKGISKNVTKLVLNSREIMQDEKGNFEEKLLLSYGYNIMTIEGWDKFGRETKETIEMVYK
ncbi:MAG: hypothetical protein WCO30_02130 [bacterium]